MKILPDWIFIGDLPSKITEDELISAFTQYGEIVSV